MYRTEVNGLYRYVLELSGQHSRATFQAALLGRIRFSNISQIKSKHKNYTRKYDNDIIIYDYIKILSLELTHSFCLTEREATGADIHPWQST